MIALSNADWLLIGAIAAIHLLSCVFVAALAARTGRCPVAWFCIALVVTAPLAVVIFLIRTRRQTAGGEASRTASEAAGAGPVPSGEFRRCPHCGKAIALGVMKSPSGVNVCPNCRLVIDREHLA